MSDSSEDESSSYTSQDDTQESVSSEETKLAFPLRYGKGRGKGRSKGRSSNYRRKSFKGRRRSTKYRDSDDETNVYRTQFKDKEKIAGREPPLFIRDEIPIPRLWELTNNSIEAWKADIMMWTTMTNTPVHQHSMILYSYLSPAIRKRLEPYGISIETITYDPRLHDDPDQPVFQIVQAVNFFLETPDVLFKHALRKFESFERTAGMDSETYCLGFARLLEKVQGHAPTREKVFSDRYCGLEFMSKLKLPSQWKTYLYLNLNLVNIIQLAKGDSVIHPGETGTRMGYDLNLSV